MRHSSDPPRTGAGGSLSTNHGALDDVARPLERSVLGIQLTGRLLGRNAPPRRDERPEPLIVDKLPEPESVVALVGEQRWLGRLRRVRQDAAQDRRRLVGVGQGSDAAVGEGAGAAAAGHSNVAP